QHDAAEHRQPRAEALAGVSPGDVAGDRARGRDGADQRQRQPWRHRDQWQRDAGGRGIDAGRQREPEVQRHRAGSRGRVGAAAGAPRVDHHLAADREEQAERDPVVPRGDVRPGPAAGEPAERGHSGLERAEQQRQDHDLARAASRQPARGRDRRGVHRETERERDRGPHRSAHARRRAAHAHDENRPAAPWPPPMHIVTTALRPPRRRSSCSAVAVSLAPVQPSGWPSAIAPPCTLSLSSGMPSSRWQYTDWLANASLSSNRSISEILSPVLASSFCTAGTGPMPMISGSTPTVANARNTPSGTMPSWSAVSRFMTSAAAAPSEIGDELPAVTLPPIANAGGSLASPSSVVSGRGSSSTVKSRYARWPASSYATARTGTISSLNAPVSSARLAFICERYANSSCICREIWNRLATFSAVMPIGVLAPGSLSISSGDADRWKPVIGTIVIDSTPPAITTSLVPTAIDPAAIAIACRPLEQNRLMVCAGTSGPRSASSEIRRATLSPCSPSGIAQPSTTSSILPLASGTRASRPRITSAASSSGRLLVRVPLWPRPTAERTASAMTISMTCSFAQFRSGL